MQLGRFATVEHGVDAYSSRPFLVEHKPMGTRKKPGEVPWPAVVIVVTVIIATISATHIIDNEISSKVEGVDTKVGGLDTRLGKVESAVKVLGSQQSNQTQKLIHDLLAAAKSATRPEIAARAAQVATALTASLKQEKRSAPSDFFETATEDVKALRKIKGADLATVAFKTQQQLAEYRSALEIAQNLQGTKFECAPGAKMRNMFGAAGARSQANRLIRGLVVINCPQLLDGFTWQNVVFVNSRISYNGGPVVLENVMFVNCTFHVQPNDDSFQFLQYAALGEKELRIKPELLRPS